MGNSTYGNPASKFDFRWVVIGGLVVLVLILGAYGLTRSPATAKASPTVQVTSIVELSTSTQLPIAMLELPTETSTATFEASTVARPSNPGGPGDAIKINLTGDRYSGQQIFISNCQPCHAAEGKGGVANPGSTDGTIPALNPIDPTIANADPQVFAYNVDLFLEHGSIPHGTNPPLMMPAYGDKKALSQQQIADVISYIIYLNPVRNFAVTFVPPTTALGIGSFMISPKDGMKLLYVPAGNFLMGSADSDPDAQADEKPQHTIYLDAFWIDQTDITNKMYALCVSTGACNQPSNTFSFAHPSYYGNSAFDNYPVMWVTWYDATAYCRWAARQLPTEAQWEKAARGTDGRIYPWGNETPDSSLLNYNRTAGDVTAVGSYPDGASPYGVLDMAGNVFQWVNDWDSDTYYESSPASNPLGPDFGQARGQRGNDWENGGSGVRSAARYGIIPSFSNQADGFRCALSAQ